MERREVVREGDEVVLRWFERESDAKPRLEVRLSLDEADILAADLMRARMDDQPKSAD